MFSIICCCCVVDISLNIVAVEFGDRLEVSLQFNLHDCSIYAGCLSHKPSLNNGLSSHKSPVEDPKLAIRRS